MRKLDRDKMKVPSILSDAEGLGKKERSDAIKAAAKYFALKNKTGNFKFNYQVYGKPAVKESVANLSKNKCAYCETAVRGASDGDVEHFRPKGAVLTKSGTLQSPAYYWLGTDWDNLFLSCDHCNKGRKRKKPDGSSVTSGKMNQFPVTDERKRITKDTQDVKEEEPYQLLLDPAKCNPGDYLQFNEDGTISAIPGQGIWTDRAEATIDVFALYRDNLKHDRERQARAVRYAIDSYKRVKETYNTLVTAGSPAAALSVMANTLKIQVDGLKVFIAEDQVFSTMAYQMIKKDVAEFPY